MAGLARGMKKFRGFMKHALGNLARHAGLAALASAAALSLAYAQYPGHIDTKKKPVQSPRAIAVLEWTGQPGKPSASRIIPVAVFDGEVYQPGGLYLARPEPLAVEPGTEYVLEQSGIAKGLFDVNSAQNLEGYWFGYGSWKQLAPPPPVHKLQPAKIMPRLEGDADSDRPRFVRRDGGSDTGSGSSSPSQPSTTQSGSSTSQNGSSTAPPATDPDRPTLRRRSTDSTDSAASTPNPGLPVPGPETPETPIGGVDPDRPHLTRGAQNPSDSDFTPTKLSGTPSALEQMVAISDASDHDPHPFTYLWADPGDAAKMQAQMETLAAQAIAAANAPKPVVKPHPAAPPSSPARAHKAPPAPPLPTLGGEQFKAYALTEGAGATLIFSAQATRPDGNVQYVTLIAQPDIYGALHVIFKSVTDDRHLGETPRMRLVDAVDATANGRADLLFEVRGKQDRQFVLYQIVGGRVDQLFTTGSLPSAQS
jgi:hypothetical protein